MNAGALNREISIQSKAIIYDSSGFGTETYTTIKKVWAEIITTGGREYYAAQRLNAETTAVFRVRYTPAINGTMRIIYGTRTFEIIGLNDVNGKRVELLISAKELTNG